QVWDATPLQVSSQGTSINSVKQLLEIGVLARNLPPTGLINAPLFPWIMWNLWKARNGLLFEDRHISAKDLVLKAIKEAKEWAIAQQSSTVTVTPRPPPRSTTTHHKCPGVSCRCCLASTHSRFIASPLMAEATAVKKALEKAICLSLDKCEVRSDCQVLVNLLKSRGWSKVLRGILQDIFHLCTFFSSISFVFVARNLNATADSLAKAALVSVNSNSLFGA
ncbi:hypothetical protein EUTSA_v10023927mg, partial [Eutrema salsugineum]